MDVYQRRRLVALSAIAAIFIFFVLLIRSCGDDDSPEGNPTGAVTTPVEETTQDEFIRDADAICLQTNTALAAIETEEDPNQAAAQRAQLLGSELDSIQSLGEPPENVDAFNRFVRALQQQVDALNDRVVAAERGTEDQVIELDTSITTLEEKVGRNAGRFGFEVCGNPDAVGESSSRGEGETSEGETGGGEATSPTTPTAPSTEQPTAPPADTGVDGGVGTAPPADAGGDGGATGGTDPGSGGVSP